MYPELMPPLLVGLGLALGFVAFLAIGRPVLRRLATRQVRRRPMEAALVILGSVLGTTLIVASMVVGDSLDRSVRQTAYDVLGPIDEVVRASSTDLGDAAAARVEALRGTSDVDGVLTVRGDLAAASTGTGGRRLASPRTLVWEVDFTAARTFGAPEPSGLEVRDPGAGPRSHQQQSRRGARGRRRRAPLRLPLRVARRLAGGGCRPGGGVGRHGTGRGCQPQHLPVSGDP